jgi:REP-associated tyrosine transposase
MARSRRISRGQIAYHVMNRASAGIELFADAADYQAFERVLAEAAERYPAMRVCSWCLMPNHFHLVLWPKQHGLLPRFMQWLGQTHAARWHAHRHSRGRGHLYQSRYRSFPIEQNGHFLQVCRYVERNPLRANLVAQARDWPYSALGVRGDAAHRLHRIAGPWPVRRPRDWLEQVNVPQDQKELAALRRSRDRGCPYGGEQWTRRTAHALGLESTLRPVGRPSKPKLKKLAEPQADRSGNRL